MRQKLITCSVVLTCVGLSGCMKMDIDISIDSKGMSQSTIVQDMSALSAMSAGFGSQSSSSSSKNTYDCAQVLKKQYSENGKKDDTTE